MTPPRLIIVCNALDDATRLERGITTDSPAASRKVLALCRALRSAGVNVVVLSLGRGRVNRQWRWHTTVIRRVQGVPVLYAPFSQMRGLSEAVSLFAPASLLLRLLRGRDSRDAVLFYNRLGAYIPTLLMARAFSCSAHFDLEDGEVGKTGFVSRLLRRLYDRTCAGGALLACSALSEMTTVKPLFCYYGTSATQPLGSRWSKAHVTVLLGGTLSDDTGAPVLLDALRRLKAEPGRPGASRLRFEITGKGPALQDFQEMAKICGGPEIVVHGRTSDIEYDAILARCEVGLALKPRTGPLARTTFPSKVVEMASAGLLVLTADISDVRTVLGSGALYLEIEEGQVLAELLCDLALRPQQARSLALQGQESVARHCEPSNAGRSVARFIFGEALC